MFEGRLYPGGTCPGKMSREENVRILVKECSKRVNACVIVKDGHFYYSQ